MDLKNLLHTAIRASLDAGKRIMEIYENEDFEVDFKGDDSPLTKADLASHHIIMKYLEKPISPYFQKKGEIWIFRSEKLEQAVDRGSY